MLLYYIVFRTCNSRSVSIYIAIDVYYELSRVADYITY